MRRSALPLVLVVSLLFSPVVFAAADPTYTALRASRPDGRTITLTNYVFDRDVLHFTLNGKLHLLAPVEGKTSGAVFIGQGSYELKPATNYERRQLAINSGDDKLTSIVDQFDSAVFLGTALVAAAEKAGAPVAGTPDQAALSRWDNYMKRQRKDLHTNMHVRLLQELLNKDEPVFVGWVDGKKYPPAALIVDPRGADDVRLTPLNSGGEQTMMVVIHDTRGGVWYSARYKSEIESGKGTVYAPLADAEHYFIDANIKGAELSATTVMTFVAGANVRVLPIDITSSLAISDASFAPAGENPTWTPVAFIQEEKKEDPDAAVVFPATLTAGQRYQLKLTYAGREVLENAGDGNFTITRRQNWYPNVGTFTDMATYELRFTTPQKFEIVGVGEQVENRVEGDSRIAVWKATHPIRVAGFNYGKFKKMSQSDKDSGTTFDVYTNPGTPDIITQINYYLAAAAEENGGGPENIKVNTASLAQSAMADGINTVRTGNMFFGPLADKRVAITQQSQWFFGQSWPTLVYMPYVAFLNGTIRNTLGLNGAKDFIDNVGAHEVAHQWWGHQVGTKTYRDEWISEGFAEFTAGVVAQQTGGWPRYNDFWEKARHNILDKPRAATISNQDAGPISQGIRLATWRNPGAYDSIVYSKGAYVLHMLRMAMYDNKNGDTAFMEMMKDFASTYAGKTASTQDFQTIAEKHATQSLHLTQDGKLDWFFSEWVYGTDIPKLASKLDFTDSGNGRYKVTGSITQSEVGDNFATVVPIYVYFEKNSFVKLGSLVLVGNTTKPVEVEVALPKKPVKFAINAMHDVLAK